MGLEIITQFGFSILGSSDLWFAKRRVSSLGESDKNASVLIVSQMIGLLEICPTSETVPSITS